MEKAKDVVFYLFEGHLLRLKKVITYKVGDKYV